MSNRRCGTTTGTTREFVTKLEEKIEELEAQLKDIDDDLEYSLLKFARENECYFCINGDGMVYIAKGEDTITITPDAKVLKDDMEHITQAEMWKILEGWK